jgi:hypothetical protein
MTLPETVNTVKIDFLRGEAIVATKDVDIWRAGKCGFGWVREESAQPNGPRAPFSAPEDQMYQAVVIPPLPTEPAVAVAVQPGKLETGSGVPAQANATPEGDSLSKLKSGFMNLFAPKTAAAAEAKPETKPESEQKSAAQSDSQTDAKSTDKPTE